MPTDDGYPTEEELERIRVWPITEPPRGMWGWFAFIKSCWWAADWGWSEDAAAKDDSGRERHEFFVSTGGWSGNEDIIDAMRGNYIAWSCSWESSRRGGHYVFALTLPRAEATEAASPPTPSRAPRD